MIYTAQCVMFLMWADTSRGEVVGGLALEISSFVGRASAIRGPTGPTSPRDISAHIKNITHWAV